MTFQPGVRSRVNSFLSYSVSSDTRIFTTRPSPFGNSFSFRPLTLSAVTTSVFTFYDQKNVNVLKLVTLVKNIPAIIHWFVIVNVIAMKHLVMHYW